MREGVVKQKVTVDYIIDLYEKAKKMKDPKKKKDLFKKIKFLSSHVGDYIVKISK